MEHLLGSTLLIVRSLLPLCLVLNNGAWAAGPGVTGLRFYQGCGAGETTTGFATVAFLPYRDGACSAYNLFGVAMNVIMDLSQNTIQKYSDANCQTKLGSPVDFRVCNSLIPTYRADVQQVDDAVFETVYPSPDCTGTFLSKSAFILSICGNNSGNGLSASAANGNFTIQQFSTAECTGVVIGKSSFFVIAATADEHASCQNVAGGGRTYVFAAHDGASTGSPSASDPLSTGAVIGIAVGCGLFGLFSVLLLFMIIRRRRASRRPEATKQIGPSFTGAESGVTNPLIAIQKLPPLGQAYTSYFFASHNWGEDRFNHKRVGRLVSYFQMHGKNVWFDAEKLSGNVEHQICRGVEESEVFLAFITKDYIEKVFQGGETEQDWCFYEFNYARIRKPKKMLAVVMEPELLDVAQWKGPVGSLGKNIYVDFSSDARFDQAVVDLCERIAQRMHEV